MAAEWNALTLREKYGEPLAGETFQVRPDPKMVVSYGPVRRVCRMPNRATGQKLDGVLEELVPSLWISMNLAQESA